MALGLGQVISWYICTVVAWVFLVFRLVIRWQKFGKLGLDDCFLILAGLCLVSDLCIQQYMWNNGMASLGTASRAEVVKIMQMIVPGSILYVTSLWAIKVALVLFYRKLASKTRLQFIHNITLGILAATWIAIVLDIVFQCFPISRKWTNDSSRTCSSKASDINYWLTVLLNIFTDFGIIILPVSMVVQLKMPLKQKLGVASMFALGLIVVITSCIRAYFSNRKETMLTCTVSMIETSIAIIVACLPALRVLILGHLSTRGGTGSYTAQNYRLSTRRPRNSAVPEAFNFNTSRKTGRDSEDELVKEGVSVSSTRAPPSEELEGRASPHGITVATEIRVSEEARGGYHGLRT